VRPRRPACARRPPHARSGRSRLDRGRGSFAREVNAFGGSVISRLAAHGDPGRRVWRAIGLDAEGLDLAAGGLAARVDFSAPAFDPQGWRRRLEEVLANGEP